MRKNLAASPDVVSLDLGGMGQGLSCTESNEHPLFSAAEKGEIESVEAMVDDEPSVVDRTTGRGRLSALHVAAANGQIQVGFLYFYSILDVFMVQVGDFVSGQCFIGIII